MTKICPQCNKTYADGVNYCIYDASVLTSSLQTTATPHVAIPPSQTEAVRTHAKTSWPYVVIAAMSLVILALAVSLAVFRFSPTIGNAGSGRDGVQQPSTPQRQEQEIQNDIRSPVSPPMTEVKPSLNPYGFWKGEWSTASGTLLGIEFTLNEVGENRIDGQIKWTMRRTARADKTDKIGMSAIEYIRGSFNPQTNGLTLKGYRKDDPNDVLVMVDDYRLTLSDDGSQLNGRARNGGPWNGRLRMNR